MAPVYTSPTSENPTAPSRKPGVPRFTVIMPVFDSASFFAAVLDSLPADLGPDFEFIVVDDCSTDGTPELIRRHPRFPALKLLSTPVNSGPATARNQGAAAARGSALFFFDADVEFLPDTFSRMRAWALAHPEIGRAHV